MNKGSAQITLTVNFLGLDTRKVEAEEKALQRWNLSGLLSDGLGFDKENEICPTVGAVHYKARWI